MNLKIIDTEDGSSTIYVEDLKESYHSKYGAVNESQHVFIDNGLSRITKKHIKILEIGFGTGLNVLLSLKFSLVNNLIINYIAIEKYPLTKNIWSKLNYADICENKNYFEQIHSVKWDKRHRINDNFSLTKIHADVLCSHVDLPNNLDLIYFDAFAPSKQIEMWNVNLFTKLYSLLTDKGILVTYASAGIVKQALRQSGFTIKRLPGPKGKFHMILAMKTPKIDTNHQLVITNI